MTTTSQKALSVLALFASTGALLSAGSTAHAAEVYLRASAFDKTLSDGIVVPMWGFAECETGWTNCGVPSAPGPQISTTDGESLAVYVDNDLPVAISLMAPGQTGGGDPTWTTDALGRRRVVSMTQEVGAGATGTYTWANPRAGTFLYQSASRPSIQVPMGLYGAMVVTPNTAPGCLSGVAAYASTEACYDAETVLVFSEVDVFLNEAVHAAGANVSDYPPTLDYQPGYLLVNGETSSALSAGDPGDRLLLRLLNAGLETHTPSLGGPRMALLAEDGFLKPGAKIGLGTMPLPAGKTIDAIVQTPSTDVTFGLSDRSARSNYTHLAGGTGMSAELEVGQGSPDDPTATTYAVDDTYSVTEDTVFVGTSVLSNDVGLAPGATVSLVNPPYHGTMVLNADGSFTYTPDADYSGFDSFLYRADDGTGVYPGWVSLEVSFENDAPVANDDGVYTNTVSGTVIVDQAHGLLGNDFDADGDELSAYVVSPPSAGTLILNSDGSFVFTGGTPNTTVTFTYAVSDGTAQSNTAQVTLDIQPVSGITLNVTDPAGAALTQFRWVVQEDNTLQPDPTVPVNEGLSMNFHKSYMRVVAQGSGAAEFAQLALDPTKRYFVSVLPSDAGDGTASSHTIGGASVPAGATSVDVTVAMQPVDTAQIAAQIFNDNSPTNGAIDGTETGLGGFQITLEDAAGRYGQNGGQMMQDAFGNPLRNSLDCFGDNAPPEGVILSCPDGSVLIQNLAPGKYGIIATPPVGTDWVQTSTIEGSKVIDAWVKAGEPPYFLEFGGPGPHAFIGFVDPGTTTVDVSVPESARRNTITGSITQFHDPKPPGSPLTTTTGSYAALAHTRAWVGLNSIAGDGPNIATVHADADGNFEMTGIPDGDYQLVVWDDYLDTIIAFQTVSVSGSGANVGEFPVNAWFGRLENNVFLDGNADGIRQEDEKPLAEQAVNLRWRDGTIYQSFPTDLEGYVPFDSVFPFFHWLVAEVDYARFEATGATVTVDGGGDTTGSPYEGILSIQDGSPRTETGPVLTQGLQLFSGETTIIDWGKKPWDEGHNGGISGIVFYSSTRGENDPRLTVGDTWEPGVPGVTVRLFEEVAADFAGNTTLVLVDETTTDAWDDSPPTGCKGEDLADAFVTDTLGVANAERCFDGWRNFQQGRPGVFDGGYAFNDIGPGTYVVEVVLPAGYELVKEEDLNVGFGDVYDTAAVAVVLPGGDVVEVVPDAAEVESQLIEPGLAQPACVGDDRVVPPYLSMFPDLQEHTPFAGAIRPLCNKKRVYLSDQGQAAADFHLFTTTPVAAQFSGLITDDIALENRPESPGFREKWSPAFLPISFRDADGREVYRTSTDAYGHYNGMAPSTFSANLPMPSGYSPAMYSVCLNDPGDGPTPDPAINTAYGNLCYTFQFMPGVTTYLDTPVLPQAAFAADFSAPDCELPKQTPVVAQVSGGPLVAPGGSVTLTSAGMVTIPNPAYQGPSAAAPYNQPTITRDHGFGDAGTLLLDGVELTGASWSDSSISVTLPASVVAGAYQLDLVRDDGGTSVHAITLHVSSETPITVSAGQRIQDAIDAAPDGALILVEPGIYDEQLIMWKPVRLQGYGAGSTIINATKRPTEVLEDWRQKIQGLLDDREVRLLPGQVEQTAVFGTGLFATELGAGVLVLGKPADFNNNPSRIDGFTIMNGDVGGGIVVNGYAHNLVISNNKVTQNSGARSGGIRVGHPDITTAADEELPYRWNKDIHIHHNAITRNGAIGEQGAGGGVSINTGSLRYEVTDNFICGNFTQGDGAGIGHRGHSHNGKIVGNDILFNQTNNPSFTRSGGGIFVGGVLPAGEEDLSEGAGKTSIQRNRIQGNQAAGGLGGGIRVEFYNGVDVAASPEEKDWSNLRIENNIITNNVAGYAGGGVSVQDVARGRLIHNTIAHNDSTATAGVLLPNGLGTTAPQPAGIVSEVHSPNLLAALAAIGGDTDFPGYSDPTLRQNIVWQNRSFSYDGTGATPALVPTLSPTELGGCAEGANYWDFGVLNSTEELRSRNSITTDGSGRTNSAADPEFLNGYCNGRRELDAAGGYQVIQANGEGGNAVDLRFGPLIQGPLDEDALWTYHLDSASPAIDYPSTGGTTTLDDDIDGDARDSLPDVGADEVVGGNE